MREGDGGTLLGWVGWGSGGGGGLGGGSEEEASRGVRISQNIVVVSMNFACTH